MNTNEQARVKWQMQWEAPSKPLAVDDPLLLPEREVRVAISIRLSESEQEQWSKNMGRSKDLVVWCRSRKKDEEQYTFESSQTAASKQKPKQERQWIRKAAKEINIKCAVSEKYAWCWVHQDCHVADEIKAALKKAAGVSGGKDECQVRLEGRECNHWIDTQIGMFRGYGLQGHVTTIDGSTKRAKW